MKKQKNLKERSLVISHWSLVVAWGGIGEDKDESLIVNG
jgi:hypothetical protein